VSLEKKVSSASSTFAAVSSLMTFVVVARRMKLACACPGPPNDLAIQPRAQEGGEKAQPMATGRCIRLLAGRTGKYLIKRALDPGFVIRAYP
jgi:hypothetical protein